MTHLRDRSRQTFPRVERLEGRTLLSYGPDPTFGAKGVAYAAFGGVATVPNAVAVQPDGKVVAVGSTTDPGVPNGRWYVARFTAAGALDPTFGVGGVVITLFTDGQAGRDHADSVAIEPGGRILVGGGTGAGFGALVRYLPDGAYDTGFGLNGRVTGSVYALQSVTGVVDLGGQILATGPSSSSGSQPFLVVGMNPDGTTNAGFGAAGLAATSRITTFGAAAAQSSGIALAPDGSIVVAATLVPVPGPGPLHAAVARFNPIGIPLAATALDFGTGFGDTAAGVVVQADGKILVAGTTFVADGRGGATPAFAVARLRPDLTLDPTYAGRGRVITPVAGAGVGATSLALQADGKLLVAGVAGTGSLTVARFNTDGTPDTGFGPNGFVTVAVNATATTTAVVFQAKGTKILLAGSSAGRTGPSRLTLARLSPVTTTPPVKTPVAKSTPPVRRPVVRPRRVAARHTAVKHL